MVKRGTSSSPLEKEILTSLVNKYKAIVECKKNDTSTIWEKKRAWETIATNFNSNAHVSERTPEQLRKLWENLKSRAKKGYSRIAQEARSGGGATVTDLDPSISRVLAIASSQITPPVNSLGEDAEPLVSDSHAVPCTVIIKEESSSEQEADSVTRASSPVPSTSQTYINEVDEFTSQEEEATHANEKPTATSKSKRKRTIQDMWELEVEEHKLRMEILEMKVRHEKEFHIMRMKHLQELHSAEMALATTSNMQKNV